MTDKTVKNNQQNECKWHGPVKCLPCAICIEHDKPTWNPAPVHMVFPVSDKWEHYEGRKLPVTDNNGKKYFL